MAKELVYQQPPRMSRSELEAEFATDDPDRILNALVAAFYTEPPDWVETHCYMFARHSGVAARNGVAIVLGSIGTCHRLSLSLIHISEPTRRTPISYAVFCLKNK